MYALATCHGMGSTFYIKQTKNLSFNPKCGSFIFATHERVLGFCRESLHTTIANPCVQNAPSGGKAPEATDLPALTFHKFAKSVNLIRKL